MINIHEQKLKVSASLSDIHVEMGLLPALTVAQDNMCEYFKLINCDGVNMVPKCNCFFVLTKSKIRFNKFLKWLDVFSVKTELSNKSKIRLALNTDFIDENGEVFASCAQEMCAMDATQRTLRMINTTLLPEDIECTKQTDLSFDRIHEEFTEEHMKNEIVVRVDNLDFYKHVNNLEYVRFMLSTLELDFLDSINVKDFEIHYLSESRCGDTLKIYNKKVDNVILFQIVKGETIITKGKLSFEKR